MVLGFGNGRTKKNAHSRLDPAQDLIRGHTHIFPFHAAMLWHMLHP